MSAQDYNPFEGSGENVLSTPGGVMTPFIRSFLIWSISVTWGIAERGRYKQNRPNGIRKKKFFLMDVSIEGCISSMSGWSDWGELWRHQVESGHMICRETKASKVVGS
jgi:hypothetical protein